MRRAHDFGDAESLALDGDGLSFEDEPADARGGQGRQEIRRDFQAEGRGASQPRQVKPGRDLRKVALLVLIGCLLVAMAALFLWQKFAGLQPVPVAVRATEPGGAAIGSAAPVPFAARAETVSSPSLAGEATPRQAPGAKPAGIALPGHGRDGGPGPSSPAVKAAQAQRPAEARVLPPKSERTEESLEAKVARLEKEVKELSERGRAASPRQAAAAGHAPKPHASRDTSKVVGMSSTSVWVRRTNGEMAELQVGDRFKNDEVIQRIDQQAQIVETDRGRYKVGF